jgi:hypothetical protein
MDRRESLSSEAGKSKLMPIDEDDVTTWTTRGERVYMTWRREPWLSRLHLLPTDFLKDAIRTARRHAPLSRPLPRIVPLPAASTSTQKIATLKTPALYSTVNQIVAQAQEVGDPREVYENLKDLTKFPRKVLKFAEDLRPPYVGECLWEPADG